MKTLRQCFMGDSFESDIRVRYPGIDWDDRAKQLMEMMKELHRNPNLVLSLEKIFNRIHEPSQVRERASRILLSAFSLSFVLFFASVIMEQYYSKQPECRALNSIKDDSTPVKLSALWGFVAVLSFSAITINAFKQKQKFDTEVSSIAKYIKTIPIEMLRLNEFRLLKDYEKYLRFQYDASLFFVRAQEYIDYSNVIIRLEQKSQGVGADLDYIGSVEKRFPNASSYSKSYLADLLRATNSDPQIALQV